MDSPHGCAMDLVLRYLRLDAHAAVDRDTIAQGLDRMGYRLQDGELNRLCDAIAGDADVLSRAAVVASQLDWRYMQRYQKERWLAIARRTFDRIDEDSDGRVSLDDLLHALSVRSVPAFTTKGYDHKTPDRTSLDPARPLGALRTLLNMWLLLDKGIEGCVCLDDLSVRSLPAYRSLQSPSLCLQQSPVT